MKTIKRPKINKSNRPLELPKLTVHLSEREVVETVLCSQVLTNSHSFNNKSQTGLEDAIQAALSSRRPGPCKGNQRIPQVVFTEALTERIHTNPGVLNRHRQQALKRKERNSTPVLVDQCTKIKL